MVDQVRGAEVEDAVHMLALLAALCSFLALFKVTVPFNLVTLGLAVLALHLAWPIAIRGRRWPYRRAE